MSTSRTSSGAAWVGWIIFAASMLLIVGMFNILEGIIALVDDQRLVVTPNKFVVVDLTQWGWTILIFGAVMVATGIGLFTAQTWARVLAIIVVGLHALSQVGWLGAYPIWSLLMIALDVVVLFALCARWSAVREDLDIYEPEAGPGRPSQQVGQHASLG
jgi:hypothetical protein